MKRNLILVITVMMMTATVQAQSSVNMGIKGGLNLFTLSADNDESFDSRASFHLGLLAHIHMSESFAMQPELVYSSQGAEYGNDLKLELNYINVPLLFQYMFNNGFRLQAGPQLGILVGAKADGADVKDDFENLDLGLTFGASYVSTSTGLGVDGRYNLGLAKVNEAGGDDIFNRGFQLGIFYMFQHSKN